MGPIDYTSAQATNQDFLRSLQGGLQLGAGIQAIQQQQAAQDLAQQRAAQYQADAADFKQNPTAQGALALSLKYPDQAKPITDAFGTYTADQQKTELRDAATLTNLLHADRSDLAVQEIDKRIEAAKNTGLPTNQLEALKSVIEKDPKAAYAHSLTIMAALPGGKDVLSNLQSVNKDARDQAESDVKVAGGQADNVQKNQGIVAQTLGSLQGKNAKPSQAVTAIKSLVARKVLSPEDGQALQDSVPTDPKALDDWFGQQRAAGMTSKEQQGYVTPDANAVLSARTQVQTTGMNNATQLAVQSAITKRNEDKGDAEPTLDTDTLSTMAQQYLAGDKSVMQNLGRGAQGAANIVALRQAITKEAKAQGLTGPQIAAKMADYQGLTAGMRTSANISARVENAISEAKELAPLAIEAGRQVSRSGFLPFGKAQVMFNTQTNDPNLKKFATANNGLVSAYAGAMARGQKPTKDDFDHARGILAEAQSQQAYEATVNQMFAEMSAASRAPQNVRSHLRDQIGGGSAHGAAPAAAAAVPALPAGWTVRVH